MVLENSDRKGVIDELTHSTLYALKFEIILHDNSSQILREQQCVKTKFGGSFYMEVLETTIEKFKLQLKVEGSDKLESNYKIQVQCSHEVEKNWITEGVDVEAEDVLAMFKVLPNTKYNCSGIVTDDGDIFLVKEISLFTCNEKNIKIQTQIEDIKTKHFR